jgi:hypothetical protein
MLVMEGEGGSGATFLVDLICRKVVIEGVVRSGIGALLCLLQCILDF